MALNNGVQASIDNRRRAVAAMRLRHLTQREIVVALVKKDVLNPSSGEPYSLGTVNADIKALRSQWREKAADDTGEWVADSLAELEEVRRQAWSKGELAIVLKSLKQEAELLGLDAPARTELSGSLAVKAYTVLANPDDWED